jgi:methoxymalonate biosynthesis protein
MLESLAEQCELVDRCVGGQAGFWDLSGEIPITILRDLGSQGILSAQIPAAYGGLDADSRHNGELTAHVGSRCSSLRSVMTSNGMAAWTVQRFGDHTQRQRYLPRLAVGELGAVGFSEPDAGSDLSAMRTEIRASGDTIVLTGQKKWVTAAAYADLLIIFGRYGEGAGVVVVPVSVPGVRIERIPAPLGCRAAGHAHVYLDNVRLPADAVLGGGGQSLPLLVTTALSYGRISVAWGCVGILRACLSAAAGHAMSRAQFGKALSEHQLVARHLAELLTAEQVASRVCEHASACLQKRSPEMVLATVLAKQVSARNAAQGAASAVQILASAGAQDGHVVARAYRDAKLMEIIEGSTEICQVILAEHALKSRENPT